MSKLPLASKLAAVRRVLAGESQAQIAAELGCCRQSLYLWIRQYKKSHNPGYSVFKPKYRRGKLHHKSISPKVERLVCDLVIKWPRLGPDSLVLKLKKVGVGISKYGVYRILVRHNLQLAELRFDYRHAHPSGSVLANNLNGANRVKIVEEYLFERKNITEVCAKWQISRTTFYVWLKRYQEVTDASGASGASYGASLVEAMARRYKRGCLHHRAISEEVRAKILGIVRANPMLSVHKVYAALPVVDGKPIATHQAVQNLFEREGLNTCQMRLSWVKETLPEGEGAVAPLYVPEMPLWRLRMLLAPFVTVPKLLLRSPLRGLSATLLFLLPISLFILWIRLIISAPATLRMGLVFATVALLFGTFFFAYSMKYYLTILMILRFAMRGSTKAANNAKANPLLINFEKVALAGDKPFVSIHVAVYNERLVVERLIAACTSQAYSAQQTADSKQQKAVSGKPLANYEVILVDDSTDETTEITKALIAADGRNLVRTYYDDDLEIYTSSPAPGSSQPLVKLIHRFSRSGFKGGALQRALENTSEKAQYIMILDADFIPYPDTIEQFVKTFQVLDADSRQQTANSSEAVSGKQTAVSNIAAVQGYQWHVLNKSQTWVTRGVRAEYSGSYVIERSGEELYGGLKQIAGSVYCIRSDLLRAFGWGTSITEDFQLTLRLYEAGYKVAFTPYIQVPAEAVSTIKKLIRQRMRWAEGASHNIKIMFKRMLFGRWEEQKGVIARNDPSLRSGQAPQSNNEIATAAGRPRNDDQGKVWVPSRLTLAEKLEFLYLAPYYLQAAFFVAGTLAWFFSEAIFHTRLPFWSAALGWSLVLTNLLALPLMNIIGLFLEESDEKDYMGIFSFIALSYIMVPFAAYAAVKGFMESSEGPWFRTPKTGIVTDTARRMGFLRLRLWPLGQPVPTPTFADLSRFKPIFGIHQPSFSVNRRKLPFLSKSILAFLLIITMFAGYASFFVPPVSASPGLLFANSTYSGNGTSQSISGVGFAPEVVIIKGGSNNAVWTSASMPANSSGFFNTSSLFAGAITSLDSNGFSVGGDSSANASGTTYHYIAMADSANDEMQIGSYAGDGNDDRNITVGFLPEMVFLKGDNSGPTVWKPASLAGDNAMFFGDTNTSGVNFIQNLTGASSDGFQVGTHSNVNASGATYYWVAFKAVGGKFKTGSYVGNSTDNRNITDPGFNLQMVWVKFQDSPPFEPGEGVLRTDAHVGDTSEQFIAAAAAANIVQDFITNGFQVGTDSRVNSGTAPPPTYHWAAWSTSLVPEFIGFLIPAAPFLPKVVKKIKDKMRKRREAKKLWKPKR